MHCVRTAYDAYTKPGALYRILSSLLLYLSIVPSSVNAGLLDILTDKTLSNGNRFAFVASQYEPKIMVVDTLDDKLADILELTHIPGPITVSEKLDSLYVTDPDNQAVTIIDLVKRKVTRKIDINMHPDVALLSPIDQHVAFGSRGGSLSVWDMDKLTEILRIDGLASGLNLSFSFDGTQLYVVEPDKKNIAVIEIQSRVKVADIPLGGSVDNGTEISAVSRSADGYTGFVSIISENRVAVLDLIRWKVKKSISVGENPIRPYSTADNRYILIPHRGDETLMVLSALSYEVIATIPTGIEAGELNTGWLDTVAFVMPKHGNEIAVVDLGKLMYAGAITLGGQPDDGLVTADSKKLFAALIDTGEIVAINARTKSIVNIITTPATGLQGIEIALSNNICH